MDQGIVNVGIPPPIVKNSKSYTRDQQDISGRKKQKSPGISAGAFKRRCILRRYFIRINFFTPVNVCPGSETLIATSL